MVPGAPARSSVFSVVSQSTAHTPGSCWMQMGSEMFPLQTRWVPCNAKPQVFLAHSRRRKYHAGENTNHARQDGPKSPPYPPMLFWPKEWANVIGNSSLGPKWDLTASKAGQGEHRWKHPTGMG